jgi:RNA polymerase primary sigma factor
MKVAEIVTERIIKMLEGGTKMGNYEVQTKFGTAKSPGNLLSHADEIRLAGLVAKGKVARAELARGINSAAAVALLRNDLAVAEDARTELLVCNQGLVRMVARRYFGTDLTHEDLMQEGQIGLLKAIDRYDPNLGTRFSTYAVCWIRQAIGRAVANTGHPIRLPPNLDQKVLMLKRAQTQLAQQLGRPPTEVELAEHLSWTVAVVREVLWAVFVAEVGSIDEIVGSTGGTGIELHEVLQDDEVAGTVDQVWSKLRNKDIAAALAELSPKEEFILRLRFGFYADQDCALSNLSDILAMSREGVRQAVNRIIEKLQPSPHLLKWREPI